jgi:dTMP kinase
VPDFDLGQAFADITLLPHGGRGRLITISGTDGSGKTTTLRVLNKYLRANGVSTKIYKVPSQEAKRLPCFESYRSDPLHSVASGRVDIFSLCLVTLGDRLFTIRTEILPRLRRGITVLVDRYLFSVLVEYLIHAPPQRDELDAIRRIVEKFPAPDLAVFAHAPFERVIERLHARSEADHVDADLELLRRRNAAFHALQRCFRGSLISTGRSVPSTLQSIVPSIHDLFGIT